MKILLTHGYFLCEDEAEKRIMKPYVPLGILYISAYLTQRNVENDVYDSTFHTRDEFADFILKEKSDCIGIYVNLVTKLSVIRIINFIRSNKELKNTKIVLGGPDVTYNVENYLKLDIDFVVCGEGEETFYELTGLLKDNKPVSDCKGISYMENGKVRTNPEREKIKDIDQLPWPAREKIELEKYIKLFKKQHTHSSLSVSTQRGCPYTCKWCSTAVYGQSYRRRSPVLVVEELKFLQKQYNVERIWFVDDVFTVSHKWMREFHQEIKKQNIKIGFECISRADRLNDEILTLLKESGCFRIWIGAESGSQKVIDAMDRRVEVTHVRKMIVSAREHGIQAGTFIMLGYPGETENDILETVHHLKTAAPDTFTTTVAYPIKGTSLYNEVEHTIKGNKNWNETTDRQLEFKRNYSLNYYKAAVRFVENEVNYHKLKKLYGWWNLKVIVQKFKSVVARFAMRILKYS